MRSVFFFIFFCVCVADLSVCELILRAWQSCFSDLAVCAAELGLCARLKRLLLCALWSWRAGAAAGCRCEVLLGGAAVGVVCAVELACRCRCGVPLQGVAGGCPCRMLLLVSLQGVAARCLWRCGRWALMEVTFLPQQKGERLVATN